MTIRGICKGCGRHRYGLNENWYCSTQREEKTDERKFNYLEKFINALDKFLVSTPGIVIGWIWFLSLIFTLVVEITK